MTPLGPNLTMTTLAPACLWFEIDLNMLRGDRVTTHRQYARNASGWARELTVGLTVGAVDEDGARYFATIESIDGDFLHLRLALDSRTRIVMGPSATGPWTGQ